MPPKPRPLADRFWPKVNKTETCWLWTGAASSDGYGRVNAGGRGGRALLAHRVAYELTRGSIPNHLVLDHLCRVPSCVNPDHLEAVPMLVNSLRGKHPKYVSHVTGICKRGHLFDEVGVKYYKNGRKTCRKCVNDCARAWKLNNPETHRKSHIAANAKYRAKKRMENGREA